MLERSRSQAYEGKTSELAFQLISAILRRMPKRTSKNINEISKDVVERIIELTEGPQRPEKNPAAVALGKLGGLKGGPARARKLTPRKRTQIARRAAKAR